ncbi:MAG: preQ(1) synthase [Dysgonamonadaceae bacterium]|nr:preQ(1) synthase [Dysgonamonadaceae bacterium]
MSDLHLKNSLKRLGRETDYVHSYSPDLLETIPNRHTENDYWVRLNCPEFTSLCPVTGQPDFATIVIGYIPDGLLVESKSLKLYLFGFRGHGAFHEDCVNIILNDLKNILRPKYIEVSGMFNPRGGISIHPFCNYGLVGSKYGELADARLFCSGGDFSLPSRSENLNTI